MARKRKVDRPLRRDVRFLGEVLGGALTRQEGEELFRLEEEIRHLAIQRRRGPKEGRAEADERLGTLLSNLSEEETEGIVRAFATYFQLVNVAEQHHRIRRARSYAMDEAAPPQRGSLAAILLRAREEGIPTGRVREALVSLRVVLTFTAHPTQATRRTILEKLYRIAKELEQRDRCSQTPIEAADASAIFREQVGILWQTNEVRRERPTVADEVKNILWYVESVLWEVVAELPQVLEAAFEKAYGEPLGERVSPLRIHSWAGGDMDGNPLVVPEVVEDTIRVHRTRALRLLLADVRALGRELSQSSRHLEVPKTLQDSLLGDRAKMPHVSPKVGPPGEEEPWREKLRFVEARLLASLAGVERRRAEDGDTPSGLLPLSAIGLAPLPLPAGNANLPPPYLLASELQGDLELLESSLRLAGGDHCGGRQIRKLVEKVRTFGLDIAELELRTVAVDARDAASWIEGSGPRTPGADRLLSALRRLAGLQAESSHPCRTLILSMAAGPEDVLAALHCARASGLWELEKDCASVDIVPLFETREALERGPEVLRTLFQDPIYRHHVLCRGQQEVMVGYSDSGKEVGLLAASGGLRRVQVELVGLSAEVGIPIRIFHGRGESVARGGGPAQQAILSLPAGSIAGQYKATEQGEALDHKYARPELAMRTLELILGGALLHSLGAQRRPSFEDEARFDEAFGELAELGRAAYRGLVWDEPLFEPFFRLATPIDEIGLLPIGSRPSKRAAGGLESLRAIPWVFAWTQNRSILPGWYGVGAAMEAYAKRKGGRDRLEEMAREWPFFRTVLDNVEMVLAKTDMGIAERYAALAPKEAREALWPRITQEHRLTRKWVKRLLGVKRLLDGNLPLQRSIALRNPYVDPMSYLQVELLQRKRRGAEGCDRALLLTLTGIAAGMRNTG